MTMIHALMILAQVGNVPTQTMALAVALILTVTVQNAVVVKGNVFTLHLSVMVTLIVAHTENLVIILAYA